MTDDEAAEIVRRMRSHADDAHRQLREQSAAAAKQFHDFTTAYLDRIARGEQPASGDLSASPEEFREEADA